ncbi:MAG: aspartyl-tRNA synthetase [Chlamydiae bacterium SM23_39]|nr:MAG: aspartyl-tRNA synthetase [Chlamydiae bacterium SM23_39]
MFDYRRTHTCGELNSSHIDKKVVLSGWVNKRRDLGKLIFVDLRDKFGITQILFDTSLQNIKKAEQVGLEDVISVMGRVVKRKDPNPKRKTGDIEIQVEDIKILSKAKKTPFLIFEPTEIKEDTRLKYRYLEMRRQKIIDNLHLRHKAILAIRNFLNEKKFIEIETPILSKSTPEGARDYLVPSRIYPGNFYALPQSPQLFKQILMIGGLDRYFQIAKCFRDEDLRADRQPEFSQVDIEMSFLKEEDLFKIIEDLFKIVFKTCLNKEIKTPFIKMTYKESMERYGTDKPDTRFKMEFIDLEEYIKRSNFDFFKEELKKGKKIKGFCIKGAEDISRKKIDKYKEFLTNFGILKFGWIGERNQNILKFFSNELIKEMELKFKLNKQDIIIFASQEEKMLNQGLDHLRRKIAKERELISSIYNFLWITDFPLFSKDSKTEEIKSEHHPFTSPNLEDIDLLDKDLLKVRSLSYDLVVNGYEIASGSQRIHDSNLQEKIFQILKLSKEDREKKFGYFLEALKYGTPPHLGIAIGLDRVIMLLAKTEDIRDVIAFPKTQKACDLMLRAPSKPDKEQLDILKIKTQYKEMQWD